MPVSLTTQPGESFVYSEKDILNAYYTLNHRNSSVNEMTFRN